MPQALALEPKWSKAYRRCADALVSKNNVERRRPGVRTERTTIAPQVEHAYWYYAMASSLDARDAGHQTATLDCLKRLVKEDGLQARKRDALFKRDAKLKPSAVRVWACSDVHYDHHGAPEWADALSDTMYQRDSLLLAGDIADTLYGVKLALQTFKRKFRRVFYVPGNHDLWIRPGLNDDEEKKFPDSIAKFLAMHQLCDEIGCEMTPAEVCQGVFVIPMYGWSAARRRKQRGLPRASPARRYSPTYDHHDPKPGNVRFDKFAKWPVDYNEAWKIFHVRGFFSRRRAATRAPRRPGTSAASRASPRSPSTRSTGRRSSATASPSATSSPARSCPTRARSTSSPSAPASPSSTRRSAPRARGCTSSATRT